MEILRGNVEVSVFESETRNDKAISKDHEEYIKRVDKHLFAPYNHLLTTPGKNLRRKLLDAINYWMDTPDDKMNIIVDIIFDVHNASLIVDDIEDGSSLRRGIPAAHAIFGVGNTINAASAVYGKILDDVLSLNNPKATKLYSDFWLIALAGQGMEIYHRDKHMCPTETEYLQMAARKTGGVLHLANDLMQLFSTEKKDLEKILTAIGIYFQINDDYQNLNSQAYFDSKGFCDDITEGKFGFPMVHAINTCPKEGKLIMDILSERTNDLDLKKRCQSLIEACGSFEYTKNKLEEIWQIIAEELERHGGNPYVDDFFIKLWGGINSI